MPPTPKLPDFLQLTEEQKKKIDEEQKNLRLSAHVRVRQNREEYRVARGYAQEQAARTNLEALTKTEAEFAPEEFKRLIHAERMRLAEGLAEQGDYEEAAKICPDESRAKEYQDLHQAVWRSDADECKCPDTEIDDPLTGTLLSIPSQNDSQLVFSRKHNRVMPLVTCGKCPHKNVRPLPRELARIAAAQKESERGEKPIHADHTLLKKDA